MLRLNSFLGFLLILITFNIAHSQVLTQKVGPGIHRIQASSVVTAIAIRSDIYLGEIINFMLSGNVLNVPLDPDAPDFTYFLSLPNPILKSQLKFAFPQAVELSLINSGDFPAIQSPKDAFRFNSDCSLIFSPVLQSEWRAGLSPPTYSRSFTTVEHVVVHHAAGSNTNANYTQVVRDIYLYHTQVNGWSDIGYNYLIAQDGTIYSGRDPENGSQDNVLGAHFCGKNSGTMGICLLGNYETAIPTTNTLSSLNTLIAFKIQKENLDPFGQYPHAFGTLEAIIGHRDGCSTACPGTNVYDQLGMIRSNVKSTLESCTHRNLEFSASTTTPRINQYIGFYNESNGYDSYVWLLEAAENPTETWLNSGSTRWTIPGNYSVSLIGTYGLLSDTLTKEDYIYIEGSLVYPTLHNGKDPIYLNTANSEIVNVLSLEGQSVNYIKVLNSSYQLNPIEAGIYLVLLSNGKVERIIIY